MSNIQKQEIRKRPNTPLYIKNFYIFLKRLRYSISVKEMEQERLKVNIKEMEEKKGGCKPLQ